MESCIYEGQVRHTRSTPTKHRFSYRLFLMYLDLDELETLFEKRYLWSASRPALARFRRSDHVGQHDQPLADAVRDLVETESGKRPDGAIRLLTNMSYFGYCFNPVSFYYCFAADSDSVEFIVAEVNNTPWGERDCYVLDCRSAAMSGSSWRLCPAKKMHVSPFMPMDVQYDWTLSSPAERLTVFMSTAKGGARIFNAAMCLNRKEITAWSLARALIRFPFQTFRVITAIYWQALLLWVKRCPFYAYRGDGAGKAAR